MEKVKFSINKSRKGKYVVNIIFNNNKKMSLPDFKFDDIESLNNKEIEVERDKGQVVKIIMDGEVIFSKPITSTKNMPHKSSGTSHTSSLSTFATAPYNFIPLDDIVVPSECIPGKDVTFDKYHEGKFTGYIKIDIKTNTPLYIRDTLNIGDEGFNSDFFSPGNKVRIPGSSLRGLIRTIVEITSYSRMQFVDHKKRYHFRSFADKSLDLRRHYREKMMAGDDNTGYYQNVKAGYLTTNDGFTYKIKPAKEITGGSKLQYARVEEDLVNGAGISIEPFSYQKVKFICDPPQKHNHTQPLFYAKVTGISKDTKNILSNPQIGYLIQSGKMPKKHLHWVIADIDTNAQPLEFAEGVIENYKNDFNRNVGDKAELLKQCKPRVDVPCFYIEEDGKVLSFGHTGLFRLAYKKSIAEFLPQDHLKHDILDIAEAIFGNEADFSSRVFFEDAYLDEDQEDIFIGESIPKILSTPKPTTFQHYLEQSIKYQSHPEEGYEGIKNYNDDTLLRGYKLYWHKSGENWEADEIAFEKDKFNDFLSENKLIRNSFGEFIREAGNKIIISYQKLSENLKKIIIEAVGKYETQHTRLIPVKKEKTFTGYIRFENLSKVELGALLFAIDLPDGCCHKIGMGKPLGLGSIKIKPTLYLSNRNTRYTDILSEWQNPIQPCNNQDETINDFKDHFQGYILRQLGGTSIIYLWQLERMKELKKMLTFPGPEDSKTDYMPLKNFKERKVLPKPTEIT